MLRMKLLLMHTCRHTIVDIHAQISHHRLCTHVDRTTAASIGHIAHAAAASGCPNAIDTSSSQRCVGRVRRLRRMWWLKQLFEVKSIEQGGRRGSACNVHYLREEMPAGGKDDKSKIGRNVTRSENLLATHDESLAAQSTSGAASVAAGERGCFQTRGKTVDHCLRPAAVESEGMKWLLLVLLSPGVPCSTHRRGDTAGD
jgi:hypothetical protein